MKKQKWEKSKFKGVQLTGKTLGIIGLGRIGKEIVKRARGLQMRVIGYDLISLLKIWSISKLTLPMSK